MESLRAVWEVLVTNAFMSGTKVYTFTSILFPDVISLNIKTTTEDKAWVILAETLKVNTVKVYIAGDYDGNSDVAINEDAAIQAYKKIKEKDNGAWIQVWENNNLILNDPIYEKI
mgnify:CR=1 FL=1